jgi:catechol 2,3-dioxygenase-like lactoylglutathione lyase family enzyme
VRRPRGATPAAGLLVLGFLGCGPAGPGLQPIFRNGRAVTSVGDSLLAFTQAGLPAIVVVHRRTQRADTLGRGAFSSPGRIQYHRHHWYVSDVEAGRPFVVVLSLDGRLLQRVDLARFGAVPHQFAVLPDDRLVFETTEGRLLALARDSVSTFVDVRGGPKTGLVIAASGGVLQALPDKHLTLYNQFGHIRWRLDWPWLETAFATDLAVDANGRIYLIAGIPAEGNFVVYGLSNITGEVVRWSTPGPFASFSVDRLGEIKPDTTE